MKLLIYSQLKTTRDAAKFLAVGGILGAVSTAAFAWKYSKSPHGKQSPILYSVYIYVCDKFSKLVVLIAYNLLDVDV